MKRFEKCGTCYFYDKEKSECHRNPPLYIDKEKSLWPFIFNCEKAWCGNWRQGTGISDYLRIEFINMKTGCRLGNPFRAKIPEPGETTATEFHSAYLHQDNLCRLDLTWMIVQEKPVNEQDT